MAAIATVLFVVLLSLVVTRVATIVLAVTGMSRESARFQARSALSGVGFTTSEAETVVNHPIRRRVILALMLIGSGGLVTAIATLLISFSNADRGQALTRVGVLVVGLAIVIGLSRSERLDRRLTRLAARLLRRRTDIDVRDYAGLLHVAGDFSVMELAVEQRDWLAGKTVGELALREEGIALLGVERRSGEYVGVPKGETVVESGDRLVLYGRVRQLRELDQRPAGAEGDQRHAERAAHANVRQTTA